MTDERNYANVEPALDPAAWRRAATDDLVDLAEHRRYVALGIDISLDATHATVVAAASIDGYVYVDVVAAWSGPTCTQELIANLPEIAERIRPRRVGWYPQGPAAAVSIAMEMAHGRGGWAPRSAHVEPITDQAAACMELTDAVRAGLIRHGNDPLLNQQVAGTARQWAGDKWSFQRRGASPVDAVYATAAAVHLARGLRAPGRDK